MSQEHSPSLPGSYFLAERYLEDRLKEAGVFHVGFYAATDAASERSANITVQIIEKAGIWLEASFPKQIAQEHEIREAFQQHGYEWVRRLGLGPGRFLNHYKTPAGKAYIDVRPHSNGAFTREYIGEDLFIPPHMVLARKFLEQEVLDGHFDAEEVFSFVDVADMYCADRSVRLRGSETGKHRNIRLSAHPSEIYDAEDVILNISEFGYRLVYDYIDAHDNHFAHFLLDDMTHVELQVKPQ